MTIQVKRNNYKLLFNHFKSNGFYYGTSCRIEDIITGQVITYGMSLLNPKDQFCKSTGRKIALTKAFKNTHLFKKEDRREIWNYYFSICKY